MKFTFEYSPIYEYRKLIFALCQISSGFFERNGFILSHNVGKEASLVVFPKWPILRNPDLWRQIEQNKSLRDKYVSAGLRLFPHLYKEISNLDKLKFQNLLQAWNKTEKPFLKILLNTFGDKIPYKNVKVYITRFGTRASYTIVGSTLLIFLRHDQDISEIAFCCLAGIFYKNVSNVDDHKSHIKGYTWEEKQRVIDFLMTQTALKIIFPKFRPIVQEIRSKEIPAKLVDESLKIYKEFGFCKSNILSILNGKVAVNNIPIKDLSLLEEKVLTLLIKHKGQPIDYETLAEAIWKESYEQFYSLEAISKIIERIRRKLRDNGISKQLIFTKRKVGYVYG